MKRKYIYIIIIALLISTINLIYYFGPVRNRYSGMRPIDQNNTIWESTDPKIILEINEKYNSSNKGTIFLKNNIEITFTFGWSDDVRVDDISKIVYHSVEWDDKLAIDTSQSLIFAGICDFSKAKCNIEVTKSNIDEIEVGDKIILYRQDYG